VHKKLQLFAPNVIILFPSIATFTMQILRNSQK
jgi:hypothetical protein